MNYLFSKLKIPIFNTLTKRPIGNIVGKGENAGNQHFLRFLQCFLLCQTHKSFQQHSYCRLQMLSIRTSLKFCHLVNTLD